jgi:beta-ureidopropionase / N-carbamoyl-L-amino-acid hydrolase
LPWPFCGRVHSPFFLHRPKGLTLQKSMSTRSLEGTLEKLSEFGRNPEGGVTRIGFSEIDSAARGYVTSLMKQAGLEVHVDPSGNLFGRRAGSEKLPTLLFGSHIDSVPHVETLMGTLAVWARLR